MEKVHKLVSELEIAITDRFKNSCNNRNKNIIADITNIVSKVSREYRVEIPPELLNNILTKSDIKDKYKGLPSVNTDLLKKILLFQLLFYNLGSENDNNTEDYYSMLSFDHIKYYTKLLVTPEHISELIELPLFLNTSLPLAENMRALNRFCEATKITMELIYKNVQESISDSGVKGFMPFWIFHKDVIGNELEWIKTIERWEVCYIVYKWHKKEGIKKSDICRKKSLNHLFTNIDDGPNSTHRLDRFLVEAEQLILSAEAGTFPI